MPATRRLIHAVDRIGGSEGGPLTIRNDTVSRRFMLNDGNSSVVFLQIGRMETVSGLAGGRVAMGGRTFTAGQLTDEPLRGGGQVVVSRTRDQRYVIHGAERRGA